MFRRLAATALLGALFALPVSADDTREVEALERLFVEFAESPSQHAALARHFRSKAEMARAEAAQHERLARGARLHHGKPTEQQFMRKRYRRIAERLLAEAAEYDARAELPLAEARKAEAERDRAETAGPSPSTTATVEAR